jgi:hypothetical protein
MSFWDNKNYAYVETKELLYREVNLMSMENNSDTVRDFGKDGYWVKLDSPTINTLLSKDCNLLTSQYQARK